MALLINNNCISCDACLPACPNQAIFEKRSDAESTGYHVSDGQGTDGTTYVISYDRCTECVGHFPEPQCAAACPIGECCVPDPGIPESKEVLLERARRLHPHKEIQHDMAWSGVRG
ncbi:MAG: 4Fe-4S dicluster domain-containing protein [Nitrospira sp.]|nr:4Fe-4S dicluster domain-containing protein [Nitrospira sp.]MBX3332630.1 4Fe-4S dicluster domain-containing protein [Nitrospira sp.]